MAATIQDLKVPYRDKVTDENGILSKVWQEFFKFLKIFIDPLGFEKTYTLLNNQAAPVKITGLVFNKDQVRSVRIEYFIQRTTSTNELVEEGTLRVVFRPKTLVWELEALPDSGPDASGITFSIDSTTGEVFYTSTNQTGDPITSKVSVRNRTMSGKNQQ